MENVLPEVYSMLMHIGLSGGALTDLAIVSERLTRIHRLSENITSSFTRWHVALGGIGMMLGGAAILGGLEKLAVKTKGYSDELVKLKRLGGEMGAFAGTPEFTKQLFDISRRVPMKVEDLMKIPGISYSIVGKDEALATWESLAKYSFLQQSDSKFTNDPTKALTDVMRAGEASGRITDASGAIDMKKFDAYLDLMSKIKAATHGTVNEQTMLALAKQGGLTLRTMSDEGIMSEAIMAQVLGGHRTGTATMSLFQQFAGGTMRARTAKGMEEMGLLKSSEWQSDKGGGVILSDEASKRLTKLISKDPFELAAKLHKEFEAQGINDPEERMRKIFRAFGRQTTQRFTAEEVNNFDQMMRERERMIQGMGAGEGFKETMSGSVSANLTSVKNAWENLQTAIAGPNSDAVISFLKQLTSVINSMQTGVQGMDPKTLEGIAKGLATLGVGLVGGGAAALLAALGPAGWLVGGIVALGTAFANNAFGIRDGMAKLESIMSELAKSEWEHVAHGFNQIKTAIKDFIDWLASMNPFGRSKAGGWSDWPGKQGGPTGQSPAPFKKSSWEGDGFGGGNIIPANFNPGDKKQVLQPVQMNLNIDGRTLAQAVSEVLEDLYTHPTGPPQANGMDHMRVQGNYSDT